MSKRSSGRLMDLWVAQQREEEWKRRHAPKVTSIETVHVSVAPETDDERKRREEREAEERRQADQYGYC